MVQLWLNYSHLSNSMLCTFYMPYSAPIFLSWTRHCWDIMRQPYHLKSKWKKDRMEMYGKTIACPCLISLGRFMCIHTHIHIFLIHMHRHMYVYIWTQVYIFTIPIENEIRALNNMILLTHTSLDYRYKVNSGYILSVCRRKSISLSLLACTMSCIFNMLSLFNIHLQWYNIFRTLPTLSSCLLPWIFCFLFTILCDKKMGT